jgi:hypothetical protein
MPEIFLNMNASKCGSNYLLEYIDETIAYLERFLLCKPDSRQAVYMEQLCNAVTVALSNGYIVTYLINGTYTKSVKVRDNMERADTAGMLAAAAAAVGNKPASMYFVDKVWNKSTRSELFAIPLVAATVNIQTWAASFIFKYMKIDSKVTQQLWYAITLCMKKRPWQCDTMLPTLLQWFYSLDLSEKNVSSSQGTVRDMGD